MGRADRLPHSRLVSTEKSVTGSFFCCDFPKDMPPCLHRWRHERTVPQPIGFSIVDRPHHGQRGGLPLSASQLICRPVAFWRGKRQLPRCGRALTPKGMFLLPPHLREVCAILAAALVRLRRHTEAELSGEAAHTGDRGESFLHFLSDQSGHANSIAWRSA
jgi:hypothetical protein